MLVKDLASLGLLYDKIFSPIQQVALAKLSDSDGTGRCHLLDTQVDGIPVVSVWPVGGAQCDYYCGPS